MSKVDSASAATEYFHAKSAFLGRECAEGGRVVVDSWRGIAILKHMCPKYHPLETHLFLPYC
jgi:hypothetical protein